MTVYAAHVSADVMDVASFKNFVKAIETFGSGGLDYIFGRNPTRVPEMNDIMLPIDWMLILRGRLGELTEALNAHKDRKIFGHTELGIYICHADEKYCVVVREVVNKQNFVTQRVSTRSDFNAGLKILSVKNLIEALTLSKELEEGRIEPIATLLTRGFRQEPPREPTVSVQKGPIAEKKEVKEEKKEIKEIKKKPISFACHE